MNKIKHVIIQAGGRGGRLEHLTDNKPKALVSVNGEPLILNQMELYPKAKHYVIADYKNEVLDKYLKLYAKVDYVIIHTLQKQTSSGIKEALKLIPRNESILILWCDLYFRNHKLSDKLIMNEKNYIGLSKTFRCRWRFVNGKLEERTSIKKGVAGVYFFKDKNELSDITDGLEFCRYLKEKNIQISPLNLAGVYEISTLNDYNRVISRHINSRPFNSIRIKSGKVVKTPINEQGEKLAKLEKNWYRKSDKLSFDFVPKVYKLHPLTLKKIDDRPLFLVSLSGKKKKKIITEIVNNLKQIHASLGKKKGSIPNSREALLDKTWERINSVSSLIPQINSSYITINGKKCINFFKKWNLVEELLKDYLLSDYVFIHGDPTFSNTLYDLRKDKIYFIDPRGYYGKEQLYGDEDYDWAKIYYSIVGNYDQFNKKNFILKIKPDNNLLKIESNGWERYENLFIDLIQRDIKKIKLIHAIIWLSFTTYAWDNYDSICAAFYNGIYLMQEIYETSH